MVQPTEIWNSFTRVLWIPGSTDESGFFLAPQKILPFSTNITRALLIWPPISPWAICFDGRTELHADTHPGGFSSKTHRAFAQLREDLGKFKVPRSENIVSSSGSHSYNQNNLVATEEAAAKPNSTITHVLTQRFTNAICKIHVPWNPPKQEHRFVIVMGDGTVGLETATDDKMSNALQEFTGTISVSWSTRSQCWNIETVPDVTSGVIGIRHTRPCWSRGT
jgi:hypothetical protein